MIKTFWFALLFAVIGLVVFAWPMILSSSGLAADLLAFTG
jgi:uncharacterized membrane protein